MVGAITVNFGSCTFNRTIGFTWYDRVLFGFTFAILFFVEMTLAHTQTRRALLCRVRARGRPRLARLDAETRGLNDTDGYAASRGNGFAGPSSPRMQPRLEEGQKIMVAARGITPVLSFALDEAQLRKATLCVLYVKEIAVYYAGGPTIWSCRMAG